MLTKTDLAQIKDLLKDLPTKKEVKKEIESSIIDNNKRMAKIFVTKQDLECLVSKDEYHKAVDQILTTLDGIYGIVKNFDQENLITSHKLSDHDIRISKIEKSIFAN